MARKSLSSRETELYNLLLQGLSYKQMAASLGVSFHTVNALVQNVFNKLGVSSRVELLVKVRNHELKNAALGNSASRDL